MRDAIKHWLVTHKNHAEARFVYEPWLDHGGDKALVENAIASWLLAHSEDAEADYVFRSWLEAGGNRDLVWDAAVAWLAKHRLEKSAVYVTKFISRQEKLQASTVTDVLSWCRAFPTDEDALWRLTQLAENLLLDGIELDVVSTAEAVVADLLRPDSRPESVTRGQVTTLFSYLIDATPMRPDAVRDRVDLLFVKWLRHPLSFGSDPKPHLKAQRISFIRRLSRLLDSGALVLEKDREPLMRFTQWLEQWDLTRKQHVASTLAELKLKHPAPDLWDLVRLET